jgi:hypothetical protein
MMKRKPVPEVIAKFFWVTPMPLRVLLTNSPILSGEYFIAQIKCYRSVTLMPNIA